MVKDDTKKETENKKDAKKPQEVKEAELVSNFEPCKLQTDNNRYLSLPTVSR